MKVLRYACFIILPSSAPDVIECSLFSVHIQRPSSYRALSYAWGDPTDLQRVLYNPKNKHWRLVVFRPCLPLDPWSDCRNLEIFAYDWKEKGVWSTGGNFLRSLIICP
jgi:hypothetical protein